MDVQTFTIPFNYRRREYTVSCARFQPASEMMIRALVTHAKYEKVFVFYERPTKHGPLFWYALPEKEDDLMAKAIATELTNRAKRRGGFKKLAGKLTVK